MTSPISRRTVLGSSLAGMATAVTGQSAAAATTADPSGGGSADDTAGDLSFPATRLARRTHRHVTETQQPFLRNHSLRSFLFARAVAARQGILPRRDYDAELVFLICALHDLGLAGHSTSDLRFEVAGADLAAGFLEDQGVTDARVDTVWEAIALHTSFHIHESPVFRRRRPAEIGIAQTGIGVDLEGPGQLPPHFLARVHAAYPRLGGGRAVFDAILQQARENPLTAPPITLAGELRHQRDPAAPYLTLDTVLDANGWGD